MDRPASPKFIEERKMEDDMLEGYSDGFQKDAVKPGPNRSRSYVHGWLNGRDDRTGKPRAKAEKLRQDAEQARTLDAPLYHIP